MTIRPFAQSLIAVILLLTLLVSACVAPPAAPAAATLAPPTAPPPTVAGTNALTTTTATLPITAATTIQTPTLMSGFVLGGLSISTTVTGLPMPALGITENVASPIEYVRTVVAMKNQEQTSTGPMAFDAQGNIYLGDDLKATISKYDSQGKFVLAWGSYGSANGQFAFTVPSGQPPNSGYLAIDSHGNVYVSDTHNSRIQKFDGNGHFLLSWGQPGSGDGEFNVTTGIAIDRADNVYVGDQGNYRIQKFDSNGKFLTKRGSQGQGNGQFTTPNVLAMDSQGNLYVGDALGHHVQKFDSNGRFITKWGSEGAGDGQFGIVDGLVVDQQGQVWVSDESSRFQVFNPDGKFVGQWVFPVTADGRKPYVFVRAVDAQGQVYIEHDLANATDTGLQYMFISVFRPRGAAAAPASTSLMTTTNALTTTTSQTETSPVVFVRKLDTSAHPVAFTEKNDFWIWVAVDHQDNLYVSDVGNNRIQKYDRNGKFVTLWGSKGSGDGQFQFAGPDGDYGPLAVDSQDNVYVADAYANRVQKFDSNGKFLAAYPITAAKTNSSLGPLTVDKQGVMYVATDTLVEKLDPNGKSLGMLGSTGSGDGQFEQGGPVVFDQQGNLYANDWARIEKFDRNGKFLLAWGSEGTGNGQFSFATQTAFDSHAHLYVADAGGRTFHNQRIQVFDPNGKYLGQWNNPGNGDGRFKFLGSIAIDTQDNIYVPDSGTGTIYVFRPRH